MATIAVVIKKEDLKDDGTWNVKIRITHKGKPAYIPTNHYVIKSQLGKGNKIKPGFIDDELAPTIKNYRRSIGEMADIDVITVHEIKARLTEKKTADIDFIAFGKTLIEKYKKAGKATGPMTTVINSLIDYKGNRLSINDITSKFLLKYEEYLRSDRTFTRNNNGFEVEQKRKPLSDSGLHNHMRDLRLIFNHAREYYNDEDRGIIKILHYPFKKYKLIKPPETRKRNRTVEEIVKIRDFVADPGSRAELARDLFMLSFYLCGMNAKDIYNYKVKGERVEYERAKTSGKRRDKAFISIKLIPEASQLINKHKLKKRYKNINTLNTAIDRGLQVISTELELDIDFYDARHSFATLARNVCRFGKDDVAMALNHVDQSTRVTDIYIAKDWSIVDEVQAGVVGLLKG